jgi:hypothetical protein
MAAQGERVVIGMDPHKRSVTIEVMAGDEAVLGGGRFATDAAGYRALLEYVRQWPDRVWAIEGCSGIGRHVALRLLGDGQEVVDVPPKLSARARVFSTGQGRKTDATDAHSVALVGTRMSGLRRSWPMTSSRCSGCSSTAAAPSVRSTPAGSPNSTPCCSSSSPAEPRCSCPPLRRASC